MLNSCLVLCLLIGCRKNPVDPGIEQPAILYNTASILNTDLGRYEPYYWRNEKIFPLPFSQAKAAYASGLEIAGENNYITGAIEPLNGQHATLPCFWKNEQQFLLPVDQLPAGFINCYARDIKVHNDKVYVFGALDLYPVLWILHTNGDTETIMIPAKPVAIAGSIRCASNLQLHNGKLYMGGDLAIRNQAGNTEHEIGYWIFDPHTKLTTWHTIEAGLQYATAFAISVSTKGTYISGEVVRNTVNPIAALWKNNGPVPLQLANPLAYRMNEIHIGSDGKLVANVLDFITRKPLAWRITEQGIIDTFKPDLLDRSNADCSSLAILDEHYAYIGTCVNNQLYEIWCNADGKSLHLELPWKKDVLLGAAKWGKR